MADRIVDNRTLVAVGNSGAPDSETWVDLAGTAAGNVDTDIKIQGGQSMGDVLTSSLIGLLYDDGAARDWSNNVFYIWINCAVVGLLDLKANGGFRIRFTGATVTDFFEVYVGGSDSWPATIAGGWAMFVIDIEGASASPSNTGGTPPATTAIQRVGWAGITAGVMPKMVDNTFIDAIWRLPDGSPGIIVEGTDGGTAHWTWDDVVFAGDVFDPSKAWGTVRFGAGGAIVLNTPIQFGANDTATHGFSDFNRIILWEDQEFAPADLYGLSALGNAGGTTDVVAGVKAGTGDDATGSQGWVIAAEAAGVRWILDFDDPNLDSVHLYGCQMIHGGDFQLDDPAVEVISCLLNDCSSARVDNALILRCTVVDANTAEGAAFFVTDDVGDIKFGIFGFSDGHAIEVVAGGPASQTSKGNVFNGYGAEGSGDAALYNNTGNDLTVSVTNGGSTPTTREAATDTITTIINAATLKITVTNQEGQVKQGIRVRYEKSDGTLIAQGETDASGVFTFDIPVADLPLTNAVIIARQKAFEDFETTLNIPIGGFDIPVSLQPDRDVDLP